MDRQILAVLARKLESQFPDARAAIDQLLVNETFRDMCADYEECSHTLEYWVESSACDSLRVQEYEQLLTDLFQEIACYLKDHS